MMDRRTLAVVLIASGLMAVLATAGLILVLARGMPKNSSVLPASAPPAMSEPRQAPPSPPSTPSTPPTQQEPRPRERVVRTGDEPWDAPTLRLPSFLIKTMDHARVEVTMDGVRRGTTTLEWTPEDLVAKPATEVGVWPPPGAVPCASIRGQVSYGAELWIAGGLHQPRLPGGEQILYCRLSSPLASVAASMRLRLQGPDGRVYRYVEFTPVEPGAESDLAIRFARTLWFEPE